MEWIRVASADELGNDEAKSVGAGRYSLALYRIDDEFFAYVLMFL
jgi:3-phenylpropionate/trans-cinnamate dioxygenase ferredoxin subunit